MNQTTTITRPAASPMRVALFASLGPAVGQGFGRFAYALLVAPMQLSLGWNYAQAGLVTSANAFGYLIGALLVGAVVARWGAARSVRVSMLVTSLGLLAMGFTESFWLMLLLRAIAGFATAIIFVGGATVVMESDSKLGSALPLGIFYAGPGLGIAVSGLLVPLLLGAAPAASWPAAWIGMGVIGLLVSLLLEPTLRQAARTTPPPARNAVRQRLFVWRDYAMLWPALVAFTLFGLGYIGYMTFIVAYMQASQVAPWLVQSFWVLLGICAGASGFIWGPIIQRLAPHHAQALILLALVVGALLPLLLLNAWSFAISALLFGGFLVLIAAITRQVRLTLPQERWTAVVGNATALFGLGQLIGPIVTGLVADMQGGLALGLFGSAALLALAMVIVLLGARLVR
ncbi:MAG: YbfB/YjiJ family MFS transporter [Chloroflexaceae bacterium]|jgi:predicted MFS family arabinose efflux permease|nr:YbfB/YjiJ family MFS transporter [Chloroflexaceae bacterium]